MKKDTQLLIRISQEEMKGFKRASEISGDNLSAWARKILRKAAASELKDIGEDAPFISKPNKSESI